MPRHSYFVSQPKAVTSKCRTMVLGHSFVARLGQFASTNRSYKVDPNFGFSESELDVHVVGVGGRTVAKVRMFDLGGGSHRECGLCWVSSTQMYDNVMSCQ